MVLLTTWRCRKRAKWVLLYHYNKNTEITHTVNLYVSFRCATSSHEGICSSVISGGVVNHQEVFGSLGLNSVPGADSCWNFNAVLHPGEIFRIVTCLYLAYSRTLLRVQNQLAWSYHCVYLPLDLCALFWHLTFQLNPLIHCCLHRLNTFNYLYR